MLHTSKYLSIMKSKTALSGIDILIDTNYNLFHTAIGWTIKNITHYFKNILRKYALFSNKAYSFDAFAYTTIFFILRIRFKNSSQWQFHLESVPLITNYFYYFSASYVPRSEWASQSHFKIDSPFLIIPYL